MQCRMQSLPIVGLFQELADATFGFINVLIAASLYFFLLQRAHEPLRPSVLIRTSTPAHADSDFVFNEQLRVLARRVLNSTIGVVNQHAWLPSPLMQRHLQCFLCQFRM